MTNGLVNWLLVSLARWLRISPGLAQVAVFVSMSFFRHAQKHPPIRLTDPVELTYWISICAAVVLLTWLTKGKHRRIWWRAGPWRTAASLLAWENEAEAATKVNASTAEPRQPGALKRGMTYVDARLAGAFTAAITGIGLFQIVAALEQARFRIHWLAALIYQLGGNPLLSSVVGAFFGFIAWAAWPEKSTRK